MTTNSPTQQQDQTKAAINKQILELKKKIQLSEGQRKAIFEISEAERKTNADEIIRLKKEIGQLVISLNENRSDVVKDNTLSKRLQSIVGPTDNKTTSEIKELLDLQIVDKSKQLNLLRYRIKQRQKYLSDLGSEYQTLVSDRAKRQVTEKIDNPLKKTTCELQNSIHAIYVQQREAEHVRIRYRDIKKTLQDDAALFESNINKLEEELHLQNLDVDRLQRINREASRMRAAARGTLLQEEREALSSAVAREREAAEGKQLVEECREELERLEKQMFHVGGKTTAKQEAEEQTTEEAGAHADSAEEAEPHPLDALSDTFQLLQQATGGATTAEVLSKFKAQKSTLERLVLLRKQNEEERQRMEMRKRSLEMQLENLKYLEAKDMEVNVQQIEDLQKEIEEQTRIKDSYLDAANKVKGTLELLVAVCQKQHLTINPQANVGTDHTNVIERIKDDVLGSVDQEELTKGGDFRNGEPADEDKWFPPPYTSLLIKTPQVQQTASPTAPQPAPGSEDDEEVPSRSFLKRQAQLVVDAKLRRKNVRMMPKRK